MRYRSRGERGVPKSNCPDRVLLSLCSFARDPGDTRPQAPPPISPAQHLLGLHCHFNSQQVLAALTPFIRPLEMRKWSDLSTVTERDPAGENPGLLVPISAHSTAHQHLSGSSRPSQFLHQPSVSSEVRVSEPDVVS